MEILQLINDIRRNGKVLIDDIIYNNPVELTIQSVEPKKVLYIRYTGIYKGDSDLFSKLFSRLYHYADQKHLIDRDTRWFVVYHDYSDLTADEKLRISICISVNQEAKSYGEFGCMELAGGRYAVGRFNLEPSQYQGAWNYMISKWLPDSGYLPDDRFCFEYYPPQEQLEDDDTGRAVEIFIPVAPL
jgi:AraC family transcriptional regulator